MTDEIKLPESVAWLYEATDGRRLLDFKPNPSSAGTWHPLYAADQMRSAVLQAKEQERERCRTACLSVNEDAENVASLADVAHFDRASYIAGYQDAAVDCDEAIRSSK